MTRPTLDPPTPASQPAPPGAPAPARAAAHWIILGGCSLAFMSAAVNAGFLIRLGTSVSHLTGDVSKVAVAMFDRHSQNPASWAYLLAAALSFVGGATMAGFFIHHPTLEISRPYGGAVALIGACLTAAHFALRSQPLAAVALAGLACGMQNALATHYRGLVLRTTHVTGLLTDLGTHLGMRLRGHAIGAWKLWIPALLVLSFMLGSALGGLLVYHWQAPFLLILGPIYLASGCAWSAARRHTSPG